MSWFWLRKIQGKRSPPFALSSISPTSAPADSVITLDAYGTGFTVNSHIFFAGVAQSTVFHDATHLSDFGNIGAAGSKTVQVYDTGISIFTNTIMFTAT